MSYPGNTLFKNALSRTPQVTPPIWMMRQAGRYHSHYRALKEKHSFLELCKVPELAAAVALGPIEAFDFDVAILFSDLLFPLEALGMGLEYSPGPVLGWHLTESNFKNLRPVSEASERLKFQGHALRATREILPSTKSLIGFVGGPWTLYTYAVEGGHAGSLSLAKAKLSLYEKFCEIIVPLLRKNIELQLANGAEVVMIFDTAAGELDPQLFNQLCVPPLNQLANQFSGRIGYYSKWTQASHLQDLRANHNWAGFGLDHRWDMTCELRDSQAGFVQGNFDQSLLFAAPEDFKAILKTYLSPIKDLPVARRAGWVCGLGHGVLPKTPEENVRWFVDFVREFFA